MKRLFLIIFVLMLPMLQKSFASDYEVEIPENSDSLDGYPVFSRVFYSEKIILENFFELCDKAYDKQKVIITPKDKSDVLYSKLAQDSSFVCDLELLDDGEIYITPKVYSEKESKISESMTERTVTFKNGNKIQEYFVDGELYQKKLTVGDDVYFLKVPIVLVETDGEVYSREYETSIMVNYSLFYDDKKQLLISRNKKVMSNFLEALVQMAVDGPILPDLAEKNRELVFEIIRYANEKSRVLDFKNVEFIVNDEELKGLLDKRLIFKIGIIKKKLDFVFENLDIKSDNDIKGLIIESLKYIKHYEEVLNRLLKCDISDSFRSAIKLIFYLKNNFEITMDELDSKYLEFKTDVDIQLFRRFCSMLESRSIYEIPKTTPAKEEYSINFLWVNEKSQDQNAKHIFGSGLNLLEFAKALRDPKRLRKIEEASEKVHSMSKLRKTFLYRLSLWLDLYPEGANFNLWYDGNLVTKEALSNTVKVVEEISKSRGVTVTLRDVRDIKFFDDKSFFLDEEVDVYYRVDLLKAAIAQHELMSGLSYVIVSDIDISPTCPNHMFDPCTMSKLGSFEYVFQRDHGFENSFFMLKNSERVNSKISDVLSEAYEEACLAKKKGDLVSVQKIYGIMRCRFSGVVKRLKCPISKFTTGDHTRSRFKFKLENTVLP